MNEVKEYFKSFVAQYQGEIRERADNQYHAHFEGHY